MTSISLTSIMDGPNEICTDHFFFQIVQYEAKGSLISFLSFTRNNNFSSKFEKIIQSKTYQQVDQLALPKINSMMKSKLAIDGS